MAFQKMSPQPSLVAGETGLTLSGGHTVAVSVATRWLDNGAGVVASGRARLISANGDPVMCPNGSAVETALSHTSDGQEVKTHGVPALAKDVLLALIGETPVVVPWPEDLLLSANIRHAAESASQTGVGDPAELLGVS